ncbi:acetoacetate--CoA ligase [Nocardia sp. NPDC052278]|uniref:acetoacetate--CoA ligase n=1 Tax=unclassified Nocardia TaxID=2637762 RepID=UPI00369BB2E4
MNTSARRARRRVTTWIPAAAAQDTSRLSEFMRWVGEHRGVDVHTYRDVHRWSIDRLSDFWDSVREHFDVIGTGFDTPALAEERMPGALWYPRARLNFAENVLRHARNAALADTAAVITVHEDDSSAALTWHELEASVASFAARLRSYGVEAGDRVAAVLPNVPEALIGMLAAASIGAVWTINSPEFSPAATARRLAQLEPKVFIAVDGYRFNGKDFGYLEQVTEIESALPSLERTILLRSLRPQADAGLMTAGTRGAGTRRDDFASAIAVPAEAEYVRLPFDHPLWVLFSSGTTGAPKGIVHGHGGILLEALKGCGLNLDMGRGDLYYVGANTSWMVWNTLVNTLATGAAIVTYSGSPTFGRADRQFQIIAQTGTTMFATGAAYLQLVERSGLEPGMEWDLTRMRSILSTGSPLPETTWAWVHEHVKHDVHLGSDSGGTDICSGFVGSNPLEPVHLGETQGPQLGVSVQVWNEDGARVVEEVGEMVITRPMPSMPVRFWGDDDGAKYAGSYFQQFPGVWTQGDWILETDDGSFVVLGRSDATLNRAGVRLGTADIYEALQHLAEVRDSLVIGVERPDGGYYMPLFVVLENGTLLDAELSMRIEHTIRSRTSPRHVPDEILQVAAIPVTHAGKKIEVPIKKLFQGYEPSRAINTSSLANPEAVEWFVDRSAMYRSRVDVGEAVTGSGEHGGHGA